MLKHDSSTARANSDGRRLTNSFYNSTGATQVLTSGIGSIEPD
ncbi:hypothetical protein [Baaleninema sp.]